MRETELDSLDESTESESTSSDESTSAEGSLNEGSINSSPPSDTTMKPDSVSSQDSTDNSQVDVPLDESSQAFSYEDNFQFYSRTDSWNQYDDLRLGTETSLRKRFEIRNMEKREVDEALLRLALRQFDEEDLAEEIVRMRGYDPDNWD